MNDLMIDLETYGLNVDCTLRSVGACFFDIETNEVGETFYGNITLQSCLDIGMYVDPQTKAWWGNQSKESQAALEVAQRPVKDVITDFRRWVITNTRNKEALRVWSHGLSFDIPILNFVQAALRLRPAWNFWNERDTRTMIWIAERRDPEETARQRASFDGVQHNALDDARNQARVMQMCFKIAEMKPFAQPTLPIQVNGNST